MYLRNTIKIFCVVMAACALPTVVDAQGVELDENWTVTVNGQTVRVNPDGSFRLANIPMTDADGDGVGDDFVRLTGVGSDPDSPINVFIESNPFQLLADGTFVLSASDLAIIDRKVRGLQSISLESESPTVELGESVQLTCTATLTDGSTLDVTSGLFTTYRATSTARADVDENGLVTGDRIAGNVGITATNDGATASIILTVVRPTPVTTVSGITRLSDGEPLADVDVEIVSQGLSAVSDENGVFEITDVATDEGSIFVDASIEIDGELFEGTSMEVDMDRYNPPDVTDAGFIDLIRGPGFLVTDASGENGDLVNCKILIDNDILLVGWGLGLCHDSANIDLDAAEDAPLLDTLNEGDEVDFSSISLGDDGLAWGVIVNFFDLEVGLDPGTGHEVLTITYRLDGAPGDYTVEFCETVDGDSVVIEVIDTNSESLTANLFDGTITIEED